MKKILISGLGGSLFPYMHFQLTNDGFEPYYVDSNEDLKYLYPDLNFIHAPLVTSESYKELVLKICEDNNINYYIPLIDEEILIAHEISSSLNKLRVIAPSKAFTELCLDKRELMKILENENISQNETYLGNEYNFEFDYPIFVKPNVGRGSKGIKKIENKKQLDAYYVLEDYEPEEVIIQKFVKGTEYTVGVLCNSENEMLSISIRRVLKKEGITISSVTESNELIENIAEKIRNRLFPKGPFNIQMFISENEKPVIFEINPRFSTTLVQSYESGIHEISLYDKYFSAKNIEPTRGEVGLYLHRHWQNKFYKK